MGQNSQYLRLVGQRAIEKYEWGRDFLVGAVMNLLSLAASVYLGLITKDDWGKHRLFFILAIVAPYAVIFGLHIVWRLFRAAVVIHVEEDKERGELKHALEQLKSAPPQIELVIHDVVMHRTGDREQRWKNGEFLVQVSAELLNLPSATVEYSAELVFRGEVIELAAIKDVNEWEIIERKYFQQSFPNTPSMLRPRQDFVTNPAPITESLGRSIRKEGWLHFQIEGMRETDIPKRTLRLYAIAKNGGSHVDRELAQDHVVRSDLVAMRKIGTSLLQLGSCTPEPEPQ